MWVGYSGFHVPFILSRLVNLDRMQRNDIDTGVSAGINRVGESTTVGFRAAEIDEALEMGLFIV
jgi:hypothetical protein